MFRRLGRKCGAGRGFAVPIAACALLLPALAAAQSAPDTAFETARAAFEAMAPADRTDLQEALVWSGDYSSTTTGAFGRRTFEGIRAFQKRTGRPETGILDAAAGRELAAAAARARTAAGFKPVRDARSGVEIGIPAALLPKTGPNPNGGSRYQSRDERVTLDTRALPGGEAELKALYERNLAITTPGRTLTYKLARPDMFVVTGETGGGRFYMRYAAGDRGIRGFTLGYDKALAPTYEKIVVAVSNSFVPFPAPGAEPTTPVASAPPGPPAPPGPTVAEAGGPARAAEAFSGWLVGPRMLVTTSAIDGCPAPEAAGQRARIVAVDRERGLARLELAADRRGPVSPVAPSSPGADLVALFIASDEGGRLVATPAVADGTGGISAPLQPGAGGAILADRTGAVVGLVAQPALGARVVAGLAVPARHPFVEGAALAAFAGLPMVPGEAGAPRQSVGAIAARMSAAILPVTCRTRRP